MGHNDTRPTMNDETHDQNDSDEQLRSHLAAGTASQPQRLVIFNGDDIDEAQASGQWISSNLVNELQR